MIERGARNLVLVSRGGANEKLGGLMTKAEAYNATMTVHQCDVGSEDDVQTLVKKISRDMPAIKGVIHSAMVLHVGETLYCHKVLLTQIGYTFRGLDIRAISVRHPPKSYRRLESTSCSLWSLTRFLYRPVVCVRDRG